MNTVMKPVWRMNTGNGVPSDFGGEVFPEFAVCKFGLSAIARLDFLWTIALTFTPTKQPAPARLSENRSPYHYAIIRPLIN